MSRLVTQLDLFFRKGGVGFLFLALFSELEGCFWCLGLGVDDERGGLKLEWGGEVGKVSCTTCILSSNALRVEKELAVWEIEELKREESKLGMPHWQHIQETLVLARASKTLEFMERHFLWYQASHVSHWMAIWFFLQGREHEPLGNL